MCVNILAVTAKIWTNETSAIYKFCVFIYYLWLDGFDGESEDKQEAEKRTQEQAEEGEGEEEGQGHQWQEEVNNRLNECRACFMCGHLLDSIICTVIEIIISEGEEVSVQH